MSARLDRLCLALLFVALVALSIHRIVSYDLWWYLATGRWVLAHGIPHSDPFSYAFPGRPWMELRWLFCVALQEIASHWGLNALILFKTALLAATFAALAALTRAPERWLGALALLAFLCLAYTRFKVRAEVVSFLGVALTLLCLERTRVGGSPRWLWALPPLQALWANCHALSVLGLVIVWTVTGGEWLQARLARSRPALAGGSARLDAAGRRRLAVFAVATTAAGCLTPYGLEGALFPLTQLGEISMGSPVGRLIDEFQSVLLAPGWRLEFVAWAVLWVASGLSFELTRPIVLSRLALWGGFALLSILAVRNVALFGIVGGSVLALNLRDWLPHAPAPRRRLAAGASRALVLAVALPLPWLAATDRLWRDEPQPMFGFGVAVPLFPIRALAFARAEELPRPILGSFGDGGYLLYEGGPRSVFVDGRIEVYGAGLGEALRALAEPAAFQQLLDRHGIGTVVLPHQRMPEAVAALEARPDWVPVYFDEEHVVYLRRAAAPERAERLAIDWREPARRVVAPPAFEAPRDWLAGVFPRLPNVRGLYGLGRFLAERGANAAAHEAFAEALARRPDFEPARRGLAITEEALRREGR